MNRRFRISWPSMDAWVLVLLLTGAIAMSIFIATTPDVMPLIG